MQVTPSAGCGDDGPACDPNLSFASLETGGTLRLAGFGTSLTAGGAWLAATRARLELGTDGSVETINAAESARWSGWALTTLDERVIAETPDLVFLEFAINDAYVPYATSITDARANWVELITRIRAALPETEIVLMTMNVVTGAGADDRPELGAYYEMVRELAGAERLRIVDAAPVWAEILAEDPARFAELVPDGVHPSAFAQCAITARMVVDVMRGCDTDEALLVDDLLARAADDCCAGF